MQVVGEWCEGTSLLPTTTVMTSKSYEREITPFSRAASAADAFTG